MKPMIEDVTWNAFHASTRTCAALLLVSLVALALSPGSPQAAKKRHEWIEGASTKTVTYEDWSLLEPGLIWDNYERDCWSIKSGEIIWFTTVLLRTCTGSVGDKVGTDGTQIGAGASYTWTENVIDQMTDTLTATAHGRQVSCLWTTPTATGTTTTTTLELDTSQGIVNRFEDATVTFDGTLLAFDQAIPLDSVGVGVHSYHVTRTTGFLTDVIDFVVNVSPAYILTSTGSSHNTVPIGHGTFTNLSPDSIFIQFEAVPLQTGLEVLLFDNQVWVTPGGSVDVEVEFYTRSGWVSPLGQQLLARVDAHMIDGSGRIMASATLTGVSTGGGPPLPATANRGVALLLAGLAGVGTLTLIQRKRKMAA